MNTTESPIDRDLSAERLSYELSRQNAAQSYNAEMSKWILASLIFINSGPFLLVFERCSDLQQVPAAIGILFYSWDYSGSFMWLPCVAKHGNAGITRHIQSDAASRTKLFRTQERPWGIDHREDCGCQLSRLGRGGLRIPHCVLDRSCDALKFIPSLEFFLCDERADRARTSRSSFSQLHRPKPARRVD